MGVCKWQWEVRVCLYVWSRGEIICHIDEKQKVPNVLIVGPRRVPNRDGVVYILTKIQGEKRNLFNTGKIKSQRPREMSLKSANNYLYSSMVYSKDISQHCA